jgi:cell wall-associated NlpC family hydrolase
MPTRKQIQAAARTWHGTPFADKGRVKGRGLDCVGLVLCVAEELGVIGLDGRPMRGADYMDYHSQPAGTLVHDECCKRLIRKLPKDIVPGDIVSMRLPDYPTHVGIITEVGGHLYIIHAYDGLLTKKCVEHILDFKWRRRIVGAFEYPGTVD